MLKVRIFSIWLIIYSMVMLFVIVPQTIAQSGGARDISLEELGYQDTVIRGPSSDSRFAFDLPAGWEIVGGSYLMLDFDYNIEFLSVTTPTLAASVEVWLNSQRLETRSIITSTTQKLRIDLPADQFRLTSNEARPNVIEVRLQANADCHEDVQSSITVKKSSLLHLVYRERPLLLDLTRFPSPIYQRFNLEPNQVRFVLPDNFDENDIRAASIIAARLGQLTANRLPISVTLASTQLTSPITGEHLIVIGQPDKNSVIRELELPVSLAERQLVLYSQMPMTVAPGSVLTYTLFVENTTSQTQSLVVEDEFSPLDRLLNCGKSCKLIAPGKIRWDIGSLAAQQQISTTVVLQLTPAITPTTSVRHTASLIDSAGKIVNVDTLAAQLDKNTDSRLITSLQERSDRFFVQGSQAVAGDAGILQEIVSPWNPQRVAVVVTGLSDEALLKAAHGLNPSNRFPGIWGESAVVQEMQPVTHTAPTTPIDVTFASLGYDNQELTVVDLQSMQYVFDFPPGIALSEAAYLSLHLAHSPSVSTVGGGIKVTLNGVAIGSAALNDSNLNDAWLQIPLSPTAIRSGSNRLRIETTVNIIDRCVVKQNYWLALYNDSFLHLRSKPARTIFDLDNFPYPFNQPGDLTNVIFALPEKPALTEIEGLLQIASLLGSSSSSNEFMPSIVFGGDPDSTPLADSHILAVGLPTMNPIIQAVNDQLPQSFLPDSNEIYQRVDKPTYLIPPNTDLGYVQTLVSPWTSGDNLELVIATGTTEVGVGWALSALAQSSGELQGNLALIRADQVSSTDTRPALVTEVLTDTTSMTSTLPLTSTVSEALSSGALETPISSQTSAEGADSVPSQQRELSEKPIVQLGSQQTTDLDVLPTASIAQTQPGWLLPLVIISVLSTTILILIWFRKAN